MPGYVRLTEVGIRGIVTAAEAALKAKENRRAAGQYFHHCLMLMSWALCKSGENHRAAVMASPV
jgi:hypothetical protein